MFWNLLKQKNKKIIYLDHAAATPLDARVLDVMMRTEQLHFANSGALHTLALDAKKVISDARASVAKHLTARPEEIIFTRGGTDSNTLALAGVIHGYTHKDSIPHVITSSIEHYAVRDLLRAYQTEGKIELTELTVDREGIISVKELHASLRPETILVSIMYANNEIGTIQPVREIAKCLRHYRKHTHAQASPYPLFHTDAIQAGNYLDIGVLRLGIDLMSISGSKIYGPKSTAVLFKKSGIPFVFPPHEGTEDIAGSAAFALALERTRDMCDTECLRLRALQSYFFDELEKAFRKQMGELRINGSRTERLPNNAHVSFPNISGERLVIELDAQGICASAKSACQSNFEGESHVVVALYGQGEEVWGSVRFSLGRSTQKQDIDTAVDALKNIMLKIKKEESMLKLQ